MKHIEFPKKWKRILAAFLDFFIMTALFSIIYFPLVFPYSFDATSYTNNLKKSQNLYVDTTLYLRLSDTVIDSPTSLGDFSTLASFEKSSITYKDIVYPVSLGDNLHSFYTDKISLVSQTPLSEDVFEKDILKIGTDTSYLASYTYDETGSHFVLKEGAKESLAVAFLDTVYTAAMKVVSSSSIVTSYTDANYKITFFSVLMAIPTLIGASIPFFLIIPLLSKNGKTIGKHIFHIAVLSKGGYELKKWKLLIRWATYIIVEIILGVCSFGASFLISYTMFLFAKNHRSIHDFVCGSVVADADSSFWFVDPIEESEYREHNEKEIPSL